MIHSSMLRALLAGDFSCADKVFPHLRVVAPTSEIVRRGENLEAVWRDTPMRVGAQDGQWVRGFVHPDQWTVVLTSPDIRAEFEAWADRLERQETEEAGRASIPERYARIDAHKDALDAEFDRSEVGQRVQALSDRERGRVTAPQVPQAYWDAHPYSIRHANRPTTDAAELEVIAQLTAWQAARMAFWADYFAPTQEETDDRPAWGEW